MSNLRLIIATCVALQCRAFAQAGAIVLHSPDSADTYADNVMLWHHLRLKRGSQELVATITFSNYHRISDIEPPHNETFDFRLLGVKYAPETGTFSVNTARGGTIQIAAFRRRLFAKSIELLPNAQVQVTRRSGHVMVDIVAAGHPFDGERWVETPRSIPSPTRRTLWQTLNSS